MTYFWNGSGLPAGQLHHYGLRRMNVRGLAGAHKTMLLTAVAFNLKKLRRFRPQQPSKVAARILGIIINAVPI